MTHNTNNITISPMRIRDWNRVKQLRETLPNPALSGGTLSLYRLIASLCFVLSCNCFLRRVIYRILPPLSTIAIVAKDNDTIAGIVWLQGTDNKDVLTAGIVIFPEYQSKGIGELLYTKIEDIARKQGVRRIELYCMTDNYKHQSLLKKIGYVPMKVFMGKELTE